MIGGGDWQFSCIDARDVGRAMAHLCTVALNKPEVFLVKGYDITWLDVKSCLDRTLGRETRLVNVPRGMAIAIGWLCERLYPFGSNPPLTVFSAEVVSTDTLFDDKKIRSTGFSPLYSFEETIINALESSN